MILEDKDLEVIGTPSIQYDDTNVIIQHIESGLWLSYKTYQVGNSVFNGKSHFRNTKWTLFRAAQIVQKWVDKTRFNSSISIKSDKQLNRF